MTAILASLIVIGSLLAAWGAVDAYRGRMRESKTDPGLYTIPKSGPRGLILGLAGAAVALISGLLGLFI